MKNFKRTGFHLKRIFNFIMFTAGLSMTLLYHKIISLKIAFHAIISLIMDEAVRKVENSKEC